MIRILHEADGQLQKVDVEPDDRVCIEPGCTTRLSRYNGGRECFVHDREQLWASLRTAKRR